MEEEEEKEAKTQKRNLNGYKQSLEHKQRNHLLQEEAPRIRRRYRKLTWSYCQRTRQFKNVRDNASSHKAGLRSSKSLVMTKWCKAQCGRRLNNY
jgi:hypothetical protein